MGFFWREKNYYTQRPRFDHIYCKHLNNDMIAISRLYRSGKATVAAAIDLDNVYDNKNTLIIYTIVCLQRAH